MWDKDKGHIKRKCSMAAQGAHFLVLVGRAGLYGRLPDLTIALQTQLGLRAHGYVRY